MKGMYHLKLYGTIERQKREGILYSTYTGPLRDNKGNVSFTDLQDH